MRKIASFAALVAVSFCLGPVSLAQPAGNLLLDKNIVIIERPDAPGPEKLAVEDLRNDFEKVFGTKPGVVTQANRIAVEIAVPTGGAPETFSITVRGNHVVLSGADMRGTMYAIYQFSQDYLGVNPMYYWNDRQPARRASIAVPANLSRSFPAPVFKYRGFFINDEDQLTGWANGEAEYKYGIAKPVMDKIFETILRLRGNMVVPGTWTFPTDPQMKWVGERGLILTQHHAIPVGMNVARWPGDVPYSYSSNAAALTRAWTNAVRSFDPNQEILWSVGLRGLSDTAYANLDTSVVGNDRRQGELISKAIAEQMQIVKRVQPNAKFATNLWQEGARLISQGLLDIPPEVMTVWADTGYGIEQDRGQVKAGQGLYYHVAMLNNRANQLSEMVPVDRIYSEFGRFIRAGATSYALLNTSDLRAVSMTARAVMEVAWSGVPASGADGYYRQWAVEQFGAQAAEAVAKIWPAYFAAIPKLANGDDYGDQLYHTEARQMLMTTMVTGPYYALPSQSPKWTAPRIMGLSTDETPARDISPTYAVDLATRELRVTGEQMAKWDAVWKQALAAETLVAPERKPFYRYYVLTGTAINRNSNHMLYLLSRAVLAVKAGDKAKARADARAALADIAEVKRLQREAEYGKWKGWWRGEFFVNFDETQRWVQSFLTWLDDPLQVPAPVIQNAWQGYHHIMRYEGNKLTDLR